MEYLLIGLQLIVSLSILNVWLLNCNKPSPWRGNGASSIKEEFKAYGLPLWSMYLIGFLKVSLAIALICAIWFPEVLKPAALGLAILLAGSILMHVKINDPIKKSFPAFLFLCLSLAIYFLSGV